MKRTRLAAKKNVLRETVNAAGETNIFNRAIQSASADNVLPSSKSSEVSAEPSKLRTRLKLENLSVEKTTVSIDTSANEKKSTKHLKDKKKLRGVVDLEMMKNELKQLEDPPVTPIEIELSSTRLPYDFFDVPCETLAQNMLGKILVRKLENGTILKGRIVETESYLGVVDKASHTYQHRITPRNAPMYMPPGTIYVYLTYGMYHCFNVSSQESGAYVTIRALEPTVGLEYMELLRNICVIEGQREKKMINNIKSLEPHELCNGPSEICTALDIDESFCDANIVTCNGLWIENNSSVEKLNIVAAPQIETEPSKLRNPSQKLLRFYILGNAFITQRDMLYEKDACDGCAVLLRAVDPIQGMEHMERFRSSRTKSKEPRKSVKQLKPHELCNGPSKLCMAFQLEKDHSKYSMCSWRSLWLEDDGFEQEIKIVQCPRIGIDSAGPEWANKPLRYYVHGNKSVSKRDKKAEAVISQSD